VNRPPSTPSHSAPAKITQVTARQFSGPIPEPEILEKYNAVSPGAADRIIAMAEQNSNHLQLMDKMKITSAFQERQRGQYFGFTIALVAISASVYLAMNGHEITAGIIGGSTLVSLVGTFIAGRLVPKSNSN